MVTRFVMERRRATRLKNVIDVQTVAMNAENQKKRTSIYASDYGQCMRKVWYQFFPDEYPVEHPESRVLRIFQNGNDVHTRLGSYLKREESLDFRDELDVPRDELDVHGRCDGICIIDGQAVVVEFKSINTEIVERAKDEHIGQLTWYMMMFKKLRKDLKDDFGYSEFDIIEETDIVGQVALSGRTVADFTHIDRWLMFTQGEIKGEIVYESKQTQETYHFPLEYDEDRAKKIRLWFEQLKWHIDNKVIPNVKYQPNFYPCSWRTGKCPYYDECWG